MFKNFFLKKEDAENFKTYMAEKLTSASGKIYQPDDIYVDPKGGMIEKSRLFFKTGYNYKYIFATLDFDVFEGKDLGDVEYVYGSFYCFDSMIKSLKNLFYIGSASIVSSHINDMGKLKTVGGNATLMSLNIDNLGELKSVGGDFMIADCKNLSSLGNLEYVGGDLDIRGSNITDLGKLKYVGGKIDLNYSQKKLFEDRIYQDGNDFYLINDNKYSNDIDYGILEIEK